MNIMKHRIGDEVTIVREVNYHDFEIGEKVEIVDADTVDGDLPYRARNDNGEMYWVSDEEIE